MEISGLTDYFAYGFYISLSAIALWGAFCVIMAFNRVSQKRFRTEQDQQDFLAAIEKRSRPVADIEDGHISTASCILANLAMDLGRPVSYDPAAREVTGDRQATRLLRKKYRKPWKHPGA